MICFQFQKFIHTRILRRKIIFCPLGKIMKNWPSGFYNLQDTQKFICLSQRIFIFPIQQIKPLTEFFAPRKYIFLRVKNILKINGGRGGVNKIFTPVLNIMKLNYSKLAKVPGVARGIFKIQKLIFV